MLLVYALIGSADGWSWQSVPGFKELPTGQISIYETLRWCPDGVLHPDFMPSPSEPQIPKSDARPST